MKLKFTQSIPDLLRQLPNGSLTAFDSDRLFDLNRFIKNLRAEASADDQPFLFTHEVRQAFAVELTDALAQIIKARIPRQRANAKPKADDTERKELQALKRAALEMREALEVFEAIANAVATREQVGAPVDNAQRIERLAPAIRPVSRALDALKDTPCRHDHLREQAEAMSSNYEALAGAISRWCTVKNVLSTGKAGGVHKSKALASWLEVCRTLSRDIAEQLRNLK